MPGQRKIATLCSGQFSVIIASRTPIGPRPVANSDPIVAFERNNGNNGYTRMASSPQANTADLKAALAHAERLLSHDPRLAGQQAEEVLRIHPGSEPAQRILAAACRRQGDAARSLALLEPLARRNTDSPGFLFELGQ